MVRPASVSEPLLQAPPAAKGWQQTSDSEAHTALDSWISSLRMPGRLDRDGHIVPRSFTADELELMRIDLRIYLIHSAAEGVRRFNLEDRYSMDRDCPNRGSMATCGQQTLEATDKIKLALLLLGENLNALEILSKSDVAIQVCTSVDSAHKVYSSIFGAIAPKHRDNNSYRDISKLESADPAMIEAAIDSVLDLIAAYQYRKVRWGGDVQRPCALLFYYLGCAADVLFRRP